MTIVAIKLFTNIGILYLENALTNIVIRHQQQIAVCRLSYFQFFLNIYLQECRIYHITKFRNKSNIVKRLQKKISMIEPDASVMS